MPPPWRAMRWTGSEQARRSRSGTPRCRRCSDRAGYQRDLTRNPPVEVTVDPATDPHGASAILIEVWDSSPDTRPVLGDSDIHSARGRGMVLVDALSSSWGADGAENERKRIWAYVTQAANDNNESPVVGHQNTAAPGPTNRTTPSSESLTTPQDNRRGSS